ncbi:hypothetical protein ATE84_2808 [Aquimarina sp. MAR_2010_214]|uniref:hypothetical protein n=1 Tax=Aquimarina sp. MAR_2010_214 TaxID=1250026 RepID=UPI000C703F2E|nr:hypothetical protein [Aquimarina sp. MAR_2010_214]PKV50742.1 hypothetical protein ATE84_2808 [Aquimarina sp. MAR_2010_214]
MGKQEKKKSKLQRKKELGKQYGVYMNAYGGYADEEKERPLVDIIEKVALHVGMIPSYLHTIIMGEGLGYLYIDLDTNYKKGKLVTDNTISGFQHLGLDFFSSPRELPRFKKYLPTGYNEGDEYTAVMENRNERYGVEQVPSANFKDLESAIYGFAAVIKHRQELFVKHYKQYGYTNPDEDQIAYWTYYYYQAEGDARRALQSRGEFDIFKDKATSRLAIHVKALERVAAWRYVQHYDIFSQ